MAKIVVSEFMDPAAVAWLAQHHEVDYRPDLVDHPETLHHALAGARALIIRNRTQIRGGLLQALKQAGVSVVGRLGVGLDNIDMPACAEAGIEVIPAVGANAASVAEYVIAAMLMLRRGAFFASAAVLAGDWPREALMGGRKWRARPLG